ncbi:MAG: hypothetical protein CL878_15700 [Dehalococcoidia bacterium]|nr:hypothetical protein [Dehalococcoidia bacterium]
MPESDTTMPSDTARVHIVISRQLVEEVDQVAGRRRRSKFFAEAVSEKLARIRRSQLAREVAGSLADVDIPGWETRESVVEWVRASRQADDKRLQRIIDES